MVERLEDRTLLATASLAFTGAVSSGAEGNTLLVNVTLTTDAPLLDTFSADVTLMDTNSEVADRTLSTMTVTFAGGTGSGATFDVSLILADDALVEGSETLVLTLSNPVSMGGVDTVSLGAQFTNGVTITDTDSASVAYQLASSSRNEDESNLAVTLVLTTTVGSTLENNAVFSVPATLGSAESADFNAGLFPMTITFFAGSGNGAIEVMAIDPASDTLIEGDETFTLGLSVTSGAAAVGTPGTHVVTLTDADTATVAFQSATTTVGEDAGATNVTLVLTTTGGNTLENNHTISVTATNGSAETADYDAFPKMVTFTTGQGNGGTQMTTIAPVNDLLVEGDETVTLGLDTTGSLLTASGMTTNEVTIDDADTATVVVDASQAVMEDVGPQGILVRLVTAGGVTLENALTVSLTAAQSTGAEAGDATFGALGSFMFAIGAGNDATNSTVTFSPTSDALVEGNELATLTPSGSSLNGQVSYSANDVTITDGDTATVAFQSMTTTVGEAAGATNVTAVLTTAPGNTLENDAVFSVTPMNGSAENADYDFGTFPKSITFVATTGNGATQNTTIDPADDTLVEGSETVTLTLAVTSGAATLGTQTTNVVTITDADAATVAFQLMTTTVGEADGATNVTAVLTMLNPGDTLENDAVFSVTPTNGSAENADYDFGAFPKSITFAGGSMDAATQNTTIDPADDTLVEGSETVTLTLAVTSGAATLGAQATNVVTITDADAATVAFQSATATAGEDAPATDVTLVLTTTPGNTLENNATITISATNGSAENADYDQGLFPKTVTFTSGQGNGGTQVVSFDPTSDTLIEGDETVTLAVVDGTLLTGSGQTSNVVTIDDADTAMVVVDAGQSVMEDGAGQGILVRLVTTGGNTLENALTVMLTAAQSTGAEAGDATFGALAGSFMFAAGAGNDATNSSLLFAPNSDDLVEGDELATLTPSGSSLNGQVSYMANDVTITDADTATVSFTSATSTENENSGLPVTMTAILTTTGPNLLENDAVFSITTTLGTAEAGDFTQNVTSITFGMGSGNGAATFPELMVTALADLLIEGDETVTFTLAPTSGAATLGATPANTLTITDGFMATVSFTSNTSTTGEDAGVTTLSATLMTTFTGLTLENDAVFSITTMLGSAEAIDFTQNVTSITFAAGSGNGASPTTNLMVTPTPDMLIEGNETVTFTLAPSSGAVTAGATPANTLTITDADAATVAFQSATATVGEDDPATDVTLVLTTAPGNTLENDASITISATNGSAENEDYDQSLYPKTVTFTAGQGNGGTQVVSFDPASDTLIEGDETVTLDVVNGTLLTGSGQTSNVVTIDDADTATVVVDASQSVMEDGGAQGITVRLVTTGGNTLENALTVSLSAAPATGTEAGDATFGALGSFMFAMGAGNNTTNSTLMFTTTPDTLVEGNELATLTPSGLSLDGQVSYTANDVTITDANTATVAYALASSSVGEDAGNLAVTLVLTTAVGDTLENNAVFSVPATLGTAESTDFNSGSFPMAVTFFATSGNGTMRVFALDPSSDTLIEGDETLTLGLSVSSGAVTLLGQLTHGVTILDADAGAATVAFQSATTTAGEDAPATNVTLVLTTTGGNTLGEDLSITVNATDGSTDATDYDSESFAKTVTFTAGQGTGGTQVVSIDPVDDLSVEGNETVTLDVIDGTVLTGSGQTSNVVTIDDADTATVVVDASQSVTEDGGAQGITVRLVTAAGVTLANALTVSLTAAQSTGAELLDATFGPLVGSFMFGNGDGNNTTNNTLMFIPNSDTLVEGNELATLTPSGSTLNGQVSYTANDVTITDADAATVAFSMATTTVGEADAATNVTAVLTMLNAGDTLENAAVFSITPTNGSAENADYDFGAFPKSITFAAASGTGATQNTTINPGDDTLVEGSETVTLTLAVTSGAATLGAQTTNVVTITDADAATVAFQSATTMVGEAAGATNVTAVLTMLNAGDMLENNAVFSVTPTNGSAENADYDFGAFPKTITFLATSGTGATQNTTIDPADDTLVEGSETVTLTLAVTSGAATLGAQTTNVVTITDADTATVAFQSATTTVGEAAGATNVTAVLTMLNAGDTLENAAVFSVTPTNGSAENADYDFGAFPKTITFLATSGTGATQNTTIDPGDDTLVEGSETVALTLAVTSGAATLGAQTTNVVTITDADAATVAFQSATTMVGEAAGATNVTAVLTMLNAGDTLENNAVFSVTPTNGSAENADYDFGAFPKTITFLATSGTGATQNTTIDPADDTLVEGSETVTLTLAVTSGAATLGAQTTNVVTITDADTATVAFQSATTTVGEAAGATNVTAVLTMLNAGDTLENNAVFSVTPTNGSAENADYDFGMFPKTITFAAASVDGATQNTTIDPANDTLVEGSETVTLTLAVTSGAATLGAQATNVVTITDADTATVAFQSATTMVGEAAGATNVTAVLTMLNAGDTLENAAVFSVTPTNGSAENADYDFGAFPKTITFAAASINGATQNTTIDPADDTLVEGSETITLTLALTSGAATLGAQTTNVVTITDADAATVAFSLATTTVGEANAATNVTAVLTMLNAGDTLENDSVFSVTPTNGSAENADYDFGAFPKTITFVATTGDGATQNTTIDPADDTLVEGSETVTLTLAVTSGAATLGTQTTNVVTITDADAATVAFSLATTTVGEAAGATNVTAALTMLNAGDTLENDAVFSVTPTNGSAENADYDFGAFPKTITFVATSADGATQNTTINPVDDSVVEGSETVTLTLAVTSGAATLGAQTTNEVTITDNDTLLVEFNQAMGTGNEGTSGNLPQYLVTGTVEAGAATITVMVDIGSSTATGGGVDFNNPTALNVPAGTYTATAMAIPGLAVLLDMATEGPETIVLNNISGIGVTVGDANGVGGTQSSTTYTITDQATLSINDVSIAEGNSGTSTLTFTVTLSSATTSGFSVGFQTADGTATTADLDYVPRNSSTGLVIGAFDGSRGGEFSLSDGASVAAMRAAILASFPGATIVDTSTLTASFLSGVDVVWLNSVFTSLTSITPLTGAEQTALQDFVSAGGGAILFGEHNFFDDTSLLSPFGLVTGSSVDNITSGTITNLAHPVTAGPFGNVTTISSNFAGNLTTLGGATSLGNWDSSGLSALAVKTSGTGRVVAFTDVNMYVDRLAAADNQKVLLNSLAFAKSTVGLQFAGTAGETQTISVLINGDVNSELNQTFNVVLGSIVGSSQVSVLDGTGVGTILNDDVVPVAPIVNDQSFNINENSANATVVGTVVATDPGDVLTYSIMSGNTGGAFAINSSTGQLTVANSAALDFETTPTFLLVVKVQDVGGLSDTATITVNLNNLQATLSINDVNQAEGNSGTSLMTFTVTLSAATGSGFSVPFNTADDTATTADNDYVALNSSSTLKVGAFDLARGGEFSLSNGASAAAMKAAILANFPGATIVGTSTLDATFLATVNVVWLHSVTTATTAISPLSGAEQLALTNFVNAGGGAIVFGEHNFFNDNSLLSPFGLATDSSNEGVVVGTITNPGHPIAVGPYGAVETISSNFSGNLTSLGSATSLGNWNSSGLSALAVLNSGAGHVVALTDVNLYTDRLGSEDNQSLLLNALAFVKPTGSLQFDGMALEEETISVTINGDITVEGSEDFSVLLTGIIGSNDVTFAIGGDTGIGTIAEDDTPSILQVSDSLVSERSKKTANATFNVTLSSPSTEAVTVNYSTTRTVSSGIAAIGTGPTATVGKDFKATTGTLRFAPGQTSQTVTVPVLDDVLHEGDETFFLQLSSASGATISDGLAQATIRDNDSGPKLNISDATVTEKGAATVEAKFTVKLSAVSAVPVTVEFSTANGTATAGADYQAAQGTITFNPGETSKTIIVVTSADLLHEGTETYFVNLSNSMDAAIVDGQGKGTIKDNDKAPKLSIGDVSVIEGRTAEFTVSLSAPSGQTVTVNFATANGTALAGRDFTATTGSLTFAAGETTKTIRVAITPDAIATATKSFKLNLSKAVNSVFADSQALATILDSN